MSFHVVDNDDDDSSSSEPAYETAEEYLDESPPVASLSDPKESLLPGSDSDPEHKPSHGALAEDAPGPEPTTINARAYQLEMLEESLKQNIIVTMDTGSGKTQVAVLRIMVELERSDKIVWFLAPTVLLALQQYNEFIQTQIPYAQSKFVCGADRAETWSEQSTWDAFLLNVRIVVSTYQILFDAVTHGFVPLQSLGLVIFDEVHNCVKRHPGARLMEEAYWPAKRLKQTVPHILGLTASPLMRSNIADLEMLEKTMDAICKSPTRHRDELLAQVNRPKMLVVPCGNTASPAEFEGVTPAMSSLEKVYRELDITRDPYILRLREEKTARSRRLLGLAVEKHDTYAQKQMRSFCYKAREMLKTFGPWAADYYIHRVVSEFLAPRITDKEFFEGWTRYERKYMAEALQKVEAPNNASQEPRNLSARLQTLLDILVSHEGDPIGIVFVKERANVAVLARILSTHPLTRERYRVGCMVGTSRMPGKKRDFLDLTQKEDLFALQRFREGDTNIMVATSVLEEGIDVPACNLVICFDKPSSLKAFIQRRGRARMRASQLYLLVDDMSDQSVVEWQSLEQEMKQKYEDDMRERTLIAGIEEAEVPDYPFLEDEDTGARLTIHDAKRHLNHLCATLCDRKFVDRNPYYVIRDLEGNLSKTLSKPSLLKATVYLPASFPPELRCAESLRSWYSETNACKDAAFQAYVNLYRAGLVNKNLLPLRPRDILGSVPARPGTTKVRQQLNPWIYVAQAWKSDGPLFTRKLTFSTQDRSVCAEFELTLPVPIPKMEPLAIYWDDGLTWAVEMDSAMQTSARHGSDTASSRVDHSSAMLVMAYGHRFPVSAEKQYPVRLVSLTHHDLSVQDIGTHQFSREMVPDLVPTRLLRDPVNADHPYCYVDWIPAKPPKEMVLRPSHDFSLFPDDVPHLVVKTWPKRAGLFRPVYRAVATTTSEKPYPRVIPMDRARVDNVPAYFSYIGMLIPAVTRALESGLIAADLWTNRLEKIGITDLSLVTTAITAASARQPTDYERLEFLGDTILKFCTATNVTAKYLSYTAGLLSAKKDEIVSNWRLCKTAIDFGLDKYIMTVEFNGRRWRPVYVDDLLEDRTSATATRHLSTKTLADVVESLIGASYVDGGITRALACMSVLLPEVGWQDIEAVRETLYQQAPADVPLPGAMQPLESLVGYTFTKKALLVEGMTHSSYHLPSNVACLERLEFIGDAILDYIVVREIFAVTDPAPFSITEMHLLRTALVNADILGFLVLEWAIEQERVDVEIDIAALDATSTDSGSSSPSGKRKREEEETSGGEGSEDGKQPSTFPLRPSTVKLPLWSFMRHLSGQITVIQRATEKRHAAMREAILDALHNGARYPWALLARLQVQKFYSDVFESLLGAVWVDSGSLDECVKVVERVGILPLMRRFVRDRVHMWHPKELLPHFIGSNDGYEYLVDVVKTNNNDALTDAFGLVKDQLYSCRLIVGDRCVAEVRDGVSMEEAQIRAAEQAYRVLESEREASLSRKV
ncbi:dicer-like protein 2 [Diplogelasinospora grovesii]|uniref:Dicer-like protein 2 n=1 Tax=Diplogelasinospora grovesii TaxID=303347 RepID=A0AAN6S9V6_9PEZI|nr:dicer-like protein 2 [Diplogelasinospora grovesii]